MNPNPAFDLAIDNDIALAMKDPLEFVGEEVVAILREGEFKPTPGRMLRVTIEEIDFPSPDLQLPGLGIFK